MARTFKTTNGDKCDSDFERAIVQQVIDAGAPYEYESIEHGRFFYNTPVTNGLCLSCDEENRGKHKPIVQKRYRTLDLYFPNTEIVVEVKGKMTGTMRNYMRELIAQNQQADIRFYFMADSWQTKAHKRTLMDWARAQGIEAAWGDPRENPGTKAYGVGGIPEDWYR